MNEEVPDGSRETEELPDWWNDWLQMTPEQFSALLETVRRIAEQAPSGGIGRYGDAAGVNRLRNSMV